MDVELIISGTALSAMGEPKATAALLKWAQAAGDDVAPYARQWFSQTRDTASFDLIEATLWQQTTFTSALVKAEVQAVMNDRNGRLKGISGR